MTVPVPDITIIIAAPPDLDLISSLESLKPFASSGINVEVIVARGQMPSAQRNQAAMHARGQWLYFLDDDSLLNDQTIERLRFWIQKKDADVVGGPNVCPDSCSFQQSVFEVLLGSFLTFGPSRSRYVPTGKIRHSNEKELILCNLLIRKQSFDQSGKFDESLYPNEENALMESIAHSGGKLWYDPNFSVDRYPRRTSGAFCKMLFRYGRGRAQQFRKYPSMGVVLNMVPTIFGAYLIALGLWVIFGAHDWGGNVGHWMLLPFYAYICTLLLQTLFNASCFGVLRSILAMFWVPVCHLLYGAGFLLGLCGQGGNNPMNTSEMKDVVLEMWAIKNNHLIRRDT